MSNAPWMNKWRRSPRQDRRVIENGKFVELGKIHDEIIVEEVPEREESALELVTATPNIPEREQISGTVFEEARYEDAVEQEASAGANVLPDAADGPSDIGLDAGVESNDTNPPASVGVTEEVFNPSISTPEGPSVSEASQAELEPLPEQSASDIALHGNKNS